MPPVRTSLDPEGYYASLGVEPTAPPAAIAAAFRSKARLLHPDVPKTGDAAAFVAVKQAYDVLSNRARRQDYDLAARRAALDAIEPAVFAYRPVPRPTPGLLRRPRFSDLPVALWLGVGAVLCVSLAEAVIHIEQPVKVVNAGIRPNAATVEPLSPAAHLATLYGPTPVVLAGEPNYYVIPTATPAVLWRLERGRNAVIPERQLPPFSSVHVVRLLRQNGMLEVLVDGEPDGYVDAGHLIPGDAAAARRGYCTYNAGPAPYDGELLNRTGYGNRHLRLDNGGVQPAVVKLRDPAGAVALSVFLAPGGHADLDTVADGSYSAEFAVGELWSRACNTFAAGMRARRLNAALVIPGNTALQITADAASLPSASIVDEIFERPRD